MKISKLITCILILSSLAFLTSCIKEESTTNPNEKGSVILKFDHKAGNEVFAFGKEFTNAAGEKMKFSMLKYYISNIVLHQENGTKYTVPRDSSYFLVDYANSVTHNIKISNIPSGTYTKISFMIGVDSTKNTEDVSKFEGALKLGQGMNWNWNAGFIFVKTEGEVTSASVTSPVSFKYHIGLFGKNGQPNNTRTVTLASQSASESKARVSASISPAFHIVVDVLGKFNAPNIIEVTKKPVVMVDNASNIIADNYAQGMFTLDHIHN